jgi:hypothetical protein
MGSLRPLITVLYYTMGVKKPGTGSGYLGGMAKYSLSPGKIQDYPHLLQPVSLLIWKVLGRAEGPWRIKKPFRPGQKGFFDNLLMNHDF